MKHWKKQWVTLSRDGYLRCFDKDDDLTADKVVWIQSDVKDVKTGNEVHDIKPPENKSKEFLLKLTTNTNPWIFCADDIDDLL